MKNKEYRLTLKVRDYECDIQGIVNNANYQHYLEYARHEYIKEIGLLSFKDMHKKGIDFVVAKIQLEYKTPLIGDDEFEVSVKMVKEGIRWVFYQNIYRKKDQKLSVKGKVDTVCLLNGKLKNIEIEDLTNK